MVENSRFCLAGTLLVFVAANSMGCSGGRLTGHMCNPPCDAGDLCTGGECVTLCNSNDQCENTELCFNGRCEVGECETDLHCEPGPACTVAGSGRCEDGTCTYTPISPPASCDDGDPCTEGDECTAEGTCVGTEIECADDQGGCRLGQCVPAAPFECIFEIQADSTACKLPGDPAGTVSGVCLLGQCQEQGACTTGDPCDDGLFCTEGDTCAHDGLCRGLALDCSDLDTDCGEASCDIAIDACAVEPSNEGAPCDDGRYCTVGDTCYEGECTGQARDCSDSDPCTANDCDEEIDACTAVPAPPADEEGPVNDPTCSDNLDNDCDGSIDAEDSACIPCLRHEDCDDGNLCSQNTCNGAGECETTLLNDVPCKDGLFCTDDICIGGVCQVSAHSCADLDGLCVAGDCSESENACVANSAVFEGESCDDGLYCTVGTTCTAGECTGAARDCSSLDDACNIGICDDNSDNCIQSPRPNGTPCDDLQFCTTDTVCNNGICGSGTAFDCGPSDACRDVYCDVNADNGNGACASTPINAGGPCTLDQCHIGSTCSAAGICTGGTAINCGTNTICVTYGTCNPASGCPAPVYTGATCNDGNSCTTGDRCEGATCEGTVQTGAACEGDCGRCASNGACRPSDAACNRVACEECNSSFTCVSTAVCCSGNCELPCYCDGNDCVYDNGSGVGACPI